MCFWGPQTLGYPQTKTRLYCVCTRTPVIHLRVADSRIDQMVFLFGSNRVSGVDLGYMLHFTGDSK